MTLTNDGDGKDAAAVLKPLHRQQPTSSGIRLTKGPHNNHEHQRVVRKRSEPPQFTLDFPIPPSFRAKVSRAWMVRTSVRALLIHVLYVRGVVPTPVLEILRQHKELSNSETTSMIPREHRSLFKCGNMLSQLLRQWEELIMSTSSCGCSNHIGAILISLGQSWSRQREQYVLQVNGLGSDAGSTISVPTVQQEHTASRRIISAFMNATNDSNGDELADFMAQPALGASSYQVQLSVWMKTSDAKRIFAATIANNGNKCLVRHNFKVKANSTKSKNKTALIQTRITTGAASAEDWDEGEGIWMTLPTVVKGFRLSR
jgi:hypothetical protein